MTMTAILNNQLLKMATERKKLYIFVTELKLEVRLNMQSQHSYTLLLV